MSSLKTTEELVEIALANATEDREEIDDHIIDLEQEASGRKSDIKYHDMAKLMAKYYEAKQRANEQIVKLANILQKREKVKEDEDYVFEEGIFDEIGSEIHVEEEVRND